MDSWDDGDPERLRAMISMKMGKRLMRIAMAIVAIGCAAPMYAQQAPSAPAQDYLVYVVSESADEITVVRFGREGARVERRVETGVLPSDAGGPLGGGGRGGEVGGGGGAGGAARGDGRAPQRRGRAARCGRVARRRALLRVAG